MSRSYFCRWLSGLKTFRYFRDTHVWAVILLLGRVLALGPLHVEVADPGKVRYPAYP